MPRPEKSCLSLCVTAWLLLCAGSRAPSVSMEPSPPHSLAPGENGFYLEGRPVNTSAGKGLLRVLQASFKVDLPTRAAPGFTARELPDRPCLPEGCRGARPSGRWCSLTFLHLPKLPKIRCLSAMRRCGARVYLGEDLPEEAEPKQTCLSILKN